MSKQDGLQNPQGKCWRCDRPAIIPKNCVKLRDHKCEKCAKIGHYEICFKSKQGQGQAQERNNCHGRGTQSQQDGGKAGGVQGGCHRVIEEDERDYYAFSTGSGLNFDL